MLFINHSEIQDESTKFVQENGSCNPHIQNLRIHAEINLVIVGDAVSTGAGKLNCKFIIHAVLPIWIGVN